jgi:hypothetical protein
LDTSLLAGTHISFTTNNGPAPQSAARPIFAFTIALCGALLFDALDSFNSDHSRFACCGLHTTNYHFCFSFRNATTS